MPNTFTLGKRAITIAVAAATILWTVGAAAFVAPLTAKAQTLADGDLIKGSLSTVYYYTDGERWTFPNEKTYFTWYTDFDDVEIISDATLASIPLAGNIVVRPGTWMIKIDTDPKSYVVTRGGEIRWVETEEVAEDLYGADWSDWIIDVPDVFFTDYDEGVSMTDAEFVDGMLVEGSEWIIWDGERRLVTSAGFTANRLQTRFIIDESSVDLNDYPQGDDIDGYVPALSDTSQQATGEAVAAGDLMVSLSSDSPDSQTIPANATNVALMAVDFEANGNDVSISNLTFDFEGVAEVDVLDDVYLYQDGARLTNGKSINTTTREVAFSSLDVDVMDGETATIWVTADVADEGFGTATVGFDLEDDGITSSAEDVSGDFPIEGEMHTLTDAASVGTVTIDETGSIADVTIGEEGVEIAKFTVEADGEDAMIEAITLNIDQADDHSNYQLWQGSTELAVGEDIGSDLVLFELEDSYTVQDGNTKTFRVTADIGGDPDDTIATGLEELSDLRAIGGDFGFGMEVVNEMGDTGAACASAADECSFVEIIGGKLTFAFNGPSASEDLLIGGDDQVLFEFTVTSQNVVQVNSFDMTIDGDNLCDDEDVDGDLDDTETNFESFEIKDENGTTLMGPEELDCDPSDDSQTLAFDDEFTMDAGDSMDLMLVADVVDTAGAADGETIAATLEMDTVDAEDADGNDLVVGEDIVPSADLVGYDLTLTDASMTVDLASAPTSGTWVKGSDDVNMVGFTFNAGEASDMTVTDATFDVLVDENQDDVFAATEVDDDGPGGTLDPDDRITSCSIFDGEGALIDGPESVTGSEVSFSGFQWTVAGGDTELMVVNCDFANLDTIVTEDDDYSVQIADADDITVEDQEGDQTDITLDGDNTDDDIEQTITDAGTLDVELAADSPDATILIGGTNDVEVAIFSFSATAESATVNEMTLFDDDDEAVSTSVSISYENADGDTVTENGVFSGGAVTFESMELFVPAEDDADVTVTIDTNTVSTTGGAAAGSNVTVTLDENTVEWTGVSSGETTVGTDAAADVTAETFELHRTKPTLSLASGSPSGSDIPGLGEVFRFNVAADSHGDVEIDELVFKLTSTDNNGETVGADWNEYETTDGAGLEESDFSLYNTDDLSDELEGADGDWDLYDSTGVLAVDDGDDDVTYINLVLTSTVEVGAGTTETFALYVETTGASSADDDSARFDLPINDSGELGLMDGTIVWVDDNQPGTFDGALVKTLPVTGGTLVY